MTEQSKGNQPSPEAELQTIDKAEDQSDGIGPPAPDSQPPVAAADRDPFEVLADDFMERCRRGEQPSIEECVSLNPDYAEQIRELFPTIAAMEQLKHAKERESGSQAVPGPIGLERLGDLNIVGEIGRGGMGIVYEAVQESLGRRVAVKVLPKQFLLDDKRLRRFRREARTAANLHHTNIVPILGVGEHEGYHYIVMQYIRGVGLDEIITRLSQQTPDPPADEEAASTGRAGEVTRVARALLSDEFAVQDRPPSTISDVGSSAGQTAGETDSFTVASHHDTPSSSIRSAITLAADELSAVDESASVSVEANSVETVPSHPRPVPQFAQPYWQSIARIGFQVADALQYAHEQSVMHRDIKPANLLMDSHGVVWVADFGLAKATEQDDVSHTGDIVGTLRYMAPEQVQGDADARSDVYSLGLTLYEMLTLQPAHEDAARKRSLLNKSELADPVRPRKINPHIPRDLETIVLKAMAAEPNHRYPSAGEMAADFANFLDDRPIQARRVSSAERLWRWCRRNRAMAGLTGTALALLILVAVLASVGYVQTKKANELIQTALNGERTQRRRAEATLEISLEAMDKIAGRFLPDQFLAGSPVTVEVDDGQQFDIPTVPAVSRETAAMLEDLLPFYDRLAEQYGDNERLRAASAKAYRRVGDIQQRVGRRDLAIAAYERAIETYKQLAQNGETEFLVEAARICNELGNVHMVLRDFGQSRDSFHNALALLEDAEDTDSSSAEVRYELARTYYNLDRRGEQGPQTPGAPPGRWGGGSSQYRIGFVEFLGRLQPRSGARGRKPGGDSGKSADPVNKKAPSRPRGRPPWQRSWENMDRGISILTELIAEHPSVPDYRHLLALCLREKAFGTLAGDPTEAIAMLEEICQESPSHIGYRYDLCKTLAMVSPLSFRWTLEDLRAGEQRLGRALEIADDLVAQYPNEPDNVIAQVDIHFKLGVNLAIRARTVGVTDSVELLDKSEEHYRSAVTAAESLASGFPDVASYKVLYAFCRGTLGHALSHRGKYHEAYTVLDSTISDLEAALKDDPNERGFGLWLSFCYKANSYVLWQIGEDDGASDEMAKAHELIRQYGQSEWKSGQPPIDNKLRSRGGPDERRGDDAP